MDRNEYMKKYHATPKGQAYSKAYNDKPEVKARKKAHNNKPEAIEYRKEWKLKSRYGITSEEYNKLFKEQHGCCIICGKHQSELKKALHVEHNHITGKVRGLTCGICNTIIGLCNEEIIILKNIINYLENEGNKI